MNIRPTGLTRRKLMKEAKEIARSLQQKLGQFGYVRIGKGDMELIRIALQAGFNDIASRNENQALIDSMGIGKALFDLVLRDADKGVRLGHCQEVVAQMGGLNGWNSVAALKQDDKPEDRTHLLKPYYVAIKEDKFSGYTGFECQAEDDAHAREQAKSAYPAGKILSVKYLEQQHKYIERGGTRCPCCGSSDISGNEWNSDAGYATQEVGCDNCQAQWLDEYTLTEVIVQDDGDGTPGDSSDPSVDDKFVCVNCGKTHDIEDSVTSEGGLVCQYCEVDVISNIEDWQRETQGSDTKLGFAEWMLHRRESRADDAKPAHDDQLPGMCFAFISSAAPGNYIVAIKRGESGCYKTTYDEPHPKKAEELVLFLNNRLGVTAGQAECMLNGSMFGWDTPGARLSRTGLSETGILAEVHSDDRVFEIKFDSTAWFRQASDDDILKLAGVEWGGAYAADKIAEFHDKDPEIAELFNYLHLIRGRQNAIGFECHVNAESAMVWLKKHRNGLWARILCQENDVSLVQAQEPEIVGMWDWVSRSTGDACDISLHSEDDAALNAVRCLNLK